MSTDEFRPVWRRGRNDPNPLFEVSPHRRDKGYKIGRDPRTLTTEELAVFEFKDPLSAIRAFYIEDCGNDISEVRKCVATGQPLWPFRMGTNPFHAKAKQKQNKAPYVLKCGSCALTFEAHRRNIRYCSERCKRKAARKTKAPA